MSKHFVDIAASIVEHGLIRKGIAKPSRVWHVDKETGKRMLLVDNSEEFSKAKTEYEKLQSFETNNDNVSG
jgi:hypothetical protein